VSATTLTSFCPNCKKQAEFRAVANKQTLSEVDTLYFFYDFFCQVCGFNLFARKTDNKQKVEKKDESQQQLQSCAVDHPDYYGGKDNPYEVIKVIEAWNLGFHLGNAVKYISRAGKKDVQKKQEDLKKAIWFIERFLKIDEKF